VLKWNDCQAMPFASTFVGHRTISSILVVLSLSWYMNAVHAVSLARRYAGLAWHRQIGQSLAATAAARACPRCNHAAGDLGRSALPGTGMALSERGIEALARPLEQRTRRPGEDDTMTATRAPMRIFYIKKKTRAAGGSAFPL
jgi:hypothetical protein